MCALTNARKAAMTRLNTPLLTILIAVLTPFSAVQAAPSGADLFATHCVACHGASGEPDPDNPALAGFDALPANFADALFNSREPGADWLLVVEYGGYAMGLSEQMPAYGDVLSPEEITAVVRHAKSLADTRDYPPGEFNYPLAIRTRKAFPEDEVVLKTRITGQDGDDSVRNVIELEKRIGKRGQAIVEVAHQSESGHDVIEEAELGFKYVLDWDLEQQYIISTGLVAAFPVKDRSESDVLIPMIMGARALSDDVLAQASARLKLPFDKTADGEAEIAGVVHWMLPTFPRGIFPGLEVVASVPFDNNGTDRVKWSVLPQARIGLTRGGHVALNLGAEIPLSDQSWDVRGYIYLLWDFADGSFFKGW
jgi:mono/diheme cytochrome c family protein